MKPFLLATALLALPQLRSTGPAPGYEIAYVDFKGIKKTIASVPDSVFASRIEPKFSVGDPVVTLHRMGSSSS